MATAFGHVSQGDAVLMIEDGVFGARKGGTFATTIERTARDAKSMRWGPISPRAASKRRIWPMA